MEKKYVTQGKLAEILTFIVRRKHATRREIESETGFSWGTVSDHVTYLLDKGYIMEEKKESCGSVGRSTFVLKPTPDRFVSIGLDINRTGLLCEIVGMDSLVKERFERDFTATTQEEVIRAAEDLCQAAIDHCKAHDRAVFSIGIAMQGPVDGKSGLSLHFPGIPDWKPYNLKEHFAARFRSPIYLAHDPKCMLLCEMWQNPCDNAILLRIDDGIGMAVSLDGKILDDTQRFELGHTLVRTPDRAGCMECLEQFASVAAIAKRANVKKQELLESPEAYTAEIAAAGDCMAVTLYNVYVMFRPQKIILTQAGARLQTYVEHACSLLKNENVELCIRPSVSAAYGAAMEGMRSAIKTCQFIVF